MIAAKRLLSTASLAMKPAALTSSRTAANVATPILAACAALKRIGTTWKEKALDTKVDYSAPSDYITVSCPDGVTRLFLAPSGQWNICFYPFAGVGVDSRSGQFFRYANNLR